MLVLLIFAVCVSISHLAGELGIEAVLQYNPNSSFIPSSTDNPTESVYYDSPSSDKNCIGRIKMLTNEDNRGPKTFIILDSTPKLYYSKVPINREPLTRAYVEKSKIQIAAARCDKGSGEFNDFFVMEKHSK